MFSRIAPTYDLLNRLLSLGVDQRWRQEAVSKLALPASALVRVLDVASGTGDLALMLKRHYPEAEVTGVDFAEPMLEVARVKAEKRRVAVEFAVADGTALPYEDGTFDAVTIAYGLRNFEDPGKGLAEFHRVLKPGGRLAILEFPPPPGGFFGRIFGYYFNVMLPAVGGLVSGERSAYSYLPQSVVAFLTPAELERRLEAAGFIDVKHRLQTFGVSALHLATAEPARRER